MDENTGVDDDVRNPGEDPHVEEELLRVAEMFNPHRDDPLMRELCRLAIMSVQERWIGV